MTVATGWLVVAGFTGYSCQFNNYTANKIKIMRALLAFVLETVYYNHPLCYERRGGPYTGLGNHGNQDMMQQGGIGY